MQKQDTWLHYASFQKVQHFLFIVKRKEFHFPSLPPRDPGNPAVFFNMEEKKLSFCVPAYYCWYLVRPPGKGHMFKAISNCMWAVIKLQGFSCICSFYHNPWPALLKALRWFPLLICQCFSYKFQVHLKGDMFQKGNQSPGIKMTWGLVEHDHHRLLRHYQRRNFKMLGGLDSSPNTFLFQLYAMSKSKV